MPWKLSWGLKLQRLLFSEPWNDAVENWIETSRGFWLTCGITEPMFWKNVLKFYYNTSYTGVGIRDRVPGIPQSRSRKSGTGTQIQNLRDLGLGPGLKFEKSGTRDWDQDASKTGFGTGTQNWKIRDRGLGPGLRFAGRGIPGLNFVGLSRGLKNSGTRSRGLKIFRDTVPVPCRPLYMIHIFFIFIIYLITSIISRFKFCLWASTNWFCEMANAVFFWNTVIKATLFYAETSALNFLEQNSGWAWIRQRHRGFSVPCLVR